MVQQQVPELEVLVELSLNLDGTVVGLADGAIVGGLIGLGIY